MTMKLRRIHNPDYEDDVKYELRLYKSIMRLIGAWPLSDKSCHRTRLFKGLVIVTCYVLILSVVIPSFLNFFLILDTFRSRLKLMPAFFFYLIVPITYSLLIYQGDNIRECLKYLENDWRNIGNKRDREIMLDKVKMGRNIFVQSTVFFFISAFTYRFIHPLMREKIVINGNITIKPLVQGYYFVLFDPQQSPAYESVVVIQCMGAIVMYTVVSSVCGITILFTLHASGNLETLDGWLANFLLYDFATIVNYHVKIQRFLHRVQDVIGGMCFMDVVRCTLLTCLIGYNLMMGWETTNSSDIVTFSIALGAFSVNIFILCYIGELLSDQGNKVNTTCCTINWYSLSNKDARGLVILIAMANYPIKLTAVKFVDLSYSAFGAIMRTSMAYINLLRTVTL